MSLVSLLVLERLGRGIYFKSSMINIFFCNDNLVGMWNRLEEGEG